VQLGIHLSSPVQAYILPILSAVDSALEYSLPLTRRTIQNETIVNQQQQLSAVSQLPGQQSTYQKKLFRENIDV